MSGQTLEPVATGWLYTGLSYQRYWKNILSLAYTSHGYRPNENGQSCHKWYTVLQAVFVCQVYMIP